MHFKEYKNMVSSDNNLNIYRGCDHGCIYCDSRSKCYQIFHDFDDIEVKENAPKILDFDLSKRRTPSMIGTGSMSDPYNHVEKDLEYTRKCLEVIYNRGFGVTILTKSTLILRDLDLIQKINDQSKAVVQMTLTTADDELCKLIEPNVAVTSERIKVLKECQKRGIPTVVWLCPFLPYINDTKENIEKLMDYIVDAGVKGIVFFGVGVTLRDGNREHFYSCLDKNWPGLKYKYIKKYGKSYEVTSDNNDELSRYIISTCQKNKIMFGSEKVFRYLRQFPDKYEQMKLF